MTHKETIEYAFNKGYRYNFNTCTLDTPLGTKVSPKIYSGQKYPTYTICIGDKKRRSFSIHRFVAYQLYGDKVFDEGVCVRHLDGNKFNLSPDNIKLGSHSDNELDKPKSVRINSSKIARASQPYSMNQKLDKSQKENIKNEYTKLKIENSRLPRGILNHWASIFKCSRALIQKIVYTEDL